MEKGKTINEYLKDTEITETDILNARISIQSKELLIKKNKERNKLLEICFNDLKIPKNKLRQKLKGFHSFEKLVHDGLEIYICKKSTENIWICNFRISRALNSPIDFKLM